METLPFQHVVPNVALSVNTYFTHTGKKERVEKAHLLLNRLGLKMTQITAIHIL